MTSTEFIREANRLARTHRTPERVAAEMGISLNALHLRMNRANMRWQVAGRWVRKPSKPSEDEQTETAA